ncbi:MAG: mechanosensitive ion channel family protein [Bacilli bacterium]|jgi:small conductance mechanosensitive channel|nr:mechanosensitive ion channel family protein [Bacilli bacterium]
MKDEKKKDGLKKVKEEAKEVGARSRTRAKAATDAILYGKNLNGRSRSQTPTWREMDNKQRAKTVAAWVFLALATAYVICGLYASTWWSGSYFAKIFSNEAPVTGNWLVDQASPILQTIFYLFLFIGISRLLRFIITFSTGHASKKAITIGKLVNSTIKYVSWIVLIFVILGVWGVNTAALVASAGIVALVIGLGAQSLIADVIGGLAIVFEQEFEVGDTVVIDEFRGVVTEIGLAATKITDAAGNIKTIHNSQITTAINLSQENSFAVVDIPVDYDQDLKAVRKLLDDNLPKIGKETKGVIGTPKFLGVQEFQDSGILLRVIASVKEENKFGVTRELNERIFTLMSDNGIDIPFNQLVISKRPDSPKRK